MRRLATLPVFLLVMLSASAAPAASACPPELCRCGNASHFGISEEAFVAKQRDRADWVALARVTRVDTLEPVVLELTRRSVTTRPIVAQLAVSRTWKGEARGTQTVLLSTTNYRSTCDLAFAPGDSYLVFAQRVADGQLQPGRCGGTVPLRDAAATLEVLGSGTDVARPPVPAEPPPLARMFHEVIAAAHTDAFLHSRTGYTGGPLWLDTASVRAAAAQLGMPAAGTERMMDSLARTTVATVRAVAVDCDLRSTVCEVRSDGHLVVIDSAARTAQGVAVTATSSFTDRRPSGASAIGMVRIRYTMQPVAGRWMVVAKRTLSQT